MSDNFAALAFPPLLAIVATSARDKFSALALPPRLPSACEPDCEASRCIPLLLQNGVSIVYVKEPMGHSSIQVTVDIYGHLIPGANVSFVDRLDEIVPEPAETTPQQSATPAQLREMELPPDLLQVVEEFGGGAWTRTTDLRIMRPSL